MGEHKAALEKKVKDRTAELAETEGKLKKMAKHVEDLKKTVEEQHLSVDDVRKMESEIKGISEAMDRATTLKEQRKKILLSTQSEVERVCNDIDSRVAMYSSALSDVQLVPEIGSTFANMKAVLDRNQLESSDTSKFLGVDLEGVVRPTALQTKRETMRKVDDVKAEHQDELDKMERGKEACGEAEAKLQIVVEKKSKSEQSLESEEQAFAAKLAVRQREVETMENKVASLRDPVALEEQMAAYERQCTELEALRVQHQEENIAKKKAVVEEINAACTLMEEHTQHLRGKFQELDEYWKKKEEQMNDVCVPPNIVLDN
jgi:kinetochore protein NDC80